MPSPPHPPYRVTYAALTDVGMRRKNNQDSLNALMDSQPSHGDPDSTSDDGSRGHFFMVADGMGAHAAGELASKLAVDNIPHSYRKFHELPPHEALRQAIHAGNDLIYAKGQSSPDLNGMGTTCSCLVLLPGFAIVGHIGDSRVYRLRGGLLEQLTFDHSLVWEMAVASKTTAEEVPSCIPKNVITRSLGPHPTVDVDLEGPFPIQPGDRFLLCSDGLSGVVEDPLIGSVLGTMPPHDAAQTLIDLANLRGGPDNISIVIAEAAYESASESPEAQPHVTDHQPAIEATEMPPAFWFTMAACLAGAIWFGVRNEMPWAIVAAFGCSAAVYIAMLQRGKTPHDEDESALWNNDAAIPNTLPGIPLGKGPHRQFDCQPGKPAAAELASVMDELAALQADGETSGSPESTSSDVVWQIDWAPFNEHRTASTQAMQAADYPTAIRSAGTAIRELMEQVRSERTDIYKAANDSVF